MPASLVTLSRRAATVAMAMAIAGDAGSAPGRPALGIGDPAPPLRAEKWLRGAPVTRFQPGTVYVARERTRRQAEPQLRR